MVALTCYVCLLIDVAEKKKKMFENACVESIQGGSIKPLLRFGDGLFCFGMRFIQT